MDHVRVAVVGGGQAGLAVSHELTGSGVEHLVLERGRVGQSWRDRWDSFCLVTPNWAMRLPGFAYDGDDPDAYLPRDEITAYLERYASAFVAPVRENTDVRKIRTTDDGFELETSAGALRADRLVLATGAYQRPHLPAGADALPGDLLQIDVSDFRNEGQLPAGRVLVVGSGQSGCQIAEELTEAGRDVVLACGRAPWVPRRFEGHDVFWWAIESGFMDGAVESLPSPAARLGANILGTGHAGGHDLNLRTLQAMGVTLVGHFRGADGRQALFAQDLRETIAWGDERNGQLMGLFRKTAAERGIPFSDPDGPPGFDDRSPDRVDLAGFGAVVFAGGFRPDYSWLGWPQAFDELGFPLQREGESTAIPGLFFIGVHFLRKRKSSLLVGVGEDASIVADAITKTLR